MSKNPKCSTRQITSINKASLVVKACQDAKGIDLAALDVRKVFDLSDYFIVVSGRSDRHVQGICNKIRANLAENSLEQPIAVEGFDDGHWVLIDLNDVIVHVFFEPLRRHYDVEGLWMQASRLKIPEIDTGQIAA
jgi:ribosome-associated protein